jgi:hypothetical protein
MRKANKNKVKMASLNRVTRQKLMINSPAADMGYIELIMLVLSHK